MFVSTFKAGDILYLPSVVTVVYTSEVDNILFSVVGLKVEVDNILLSAVV